MLSNGMRGVGRGLGLILALAIGSLALTGCANNKARVSAAEEESLALRDQNATLEQSLRERDAKVAELETALANCAPATAPAPVAAAPVTTWTPAAPVATPRFEADEQFQRDAKGDLRASIAGNVLFDSGQATVKTSARKELDRIASKLNGAYRGAAIRIEGHTDSDPIRRSKWSSNEALSQARADAVKKYLVSKGVSASRLESIGYGSSQPKGTKASSRRVEIVVTQ
jgi:outer membrane protein OmpA-like peptidoglycan-associated protein